MEAIRIKGAGHQRLGGADLGDGLCDEIGNVASSHQELARPISGRVRGVRVAALEDAGGGLVAQVMASSKICVGVGEGCGDVAASVMLSPFLSCDPNTGQAQQVQEVCLVIDYCHTFTSRSGVG